METLNLLLDLLLVLALLLTGIGTLWSRDLFRAVVMFIAFGLFMSLAWVRLQAPDLAMAEAAIGAGLAGALLLDTVGQLRERTPAPQWVLPGLAGGLCAALLLTLCVALLAHPQPDTKLGEALSAAMPSSGVSHELTAVLLNFRGYDTFLEVCVLAVTAFTSLALQSLQAQPLPLQRISNRLLDALVVWLVPVMLMVAVYLFWAGSKEPGGAFQAGALLAAAGVLLRLSGVAISCLQSGLSLRLGLVAGIGVFLLAGLSGPFLGRPLFSYHAQWAGLIIVAVEAVLALSIALTLLSLFTAAPPVKTEGPDAS